MEFHPLQNQTVAASADASSSSSSSTAAVREYPPPTGHPHTLPHKRTYPLSFLTAEQVKSFDELGFLVVRAEDIWTNDEMKLMLASVNQMDSWPDAPGKWMKYYEKKRVNNVPTDEKILCRVENFTQYSPGLDFVLNGHKLMSIMSELFGEQAILYKEKINYKLPGADGFAPHQDVAAGWWMYGQGLHISTLICIDEATEENGCLELSKGAEHRKGMLSDPWKEIPSDVVETLTWESAPTKPGDVIFFDSFVPHKSAPNNSNKPRRVLYATYAKSSEGDFRDRYYADKRQSYPPDCERDPSKVYAYKI